jgi:hypothetical protein
MIVELIDRYVIALLKHEKTQSNKEELEFYHKQAFQFDLKSIEFELNELYYAHAQVWDLKDRIRSDREKLNFEEIGKMAVDISNLDIQRESIKKTIKLKLEVTTDDSPKGHFSQ